MTAHRSSSRSRTDTPELTPDVGLAEWTSKIKAMQRQVDADEEAEQIRLEEEIAASRLARIRRSQGLGYGTRTNSLDVSVIKDGGVNFFRGEPEATSIDTHRTLVEKQSNHADTLQRLTQVSSSSPSVPTPTKDLRADKPSMIIPTPSDPKFQPISLAAFMGGRATGPRLNKHTPQQDAHDPTQFQQRAFGHAPHPTFGTGGVAMPGIVVQRDRLMKPSAVAALSKTRHSGRVSELLPATETYQRQSPLPRGTEMRERTISTPSYASSSSWATTNQAKPVSPTPHNPYLPSTHIATGTEIQDLDTRAQSTCSTPPRSKTVDHPVTPRQAADVGMTPPSKSPVTVPSLAGPIHPQPRPSTIGPQIPTSSAPSKAFLRPLPQKEPTPSLSRLQGRGFVQSMVQVSSQLESPLASNPETPTSDKPASGRKSSVLDRWQPNISPSTPSSSSPTPRSMRRSVTTDSTTMDKSKVPLVDPLKKPLKGRASNSSLRQENISPRPGPPKPNGSEGNLPTGLGSATTLVVYKPKPVDAPAIDELGFKPFEVSHGAKDAALDSPAPSRPLSHPTKDRARKPRKQKASPDDTRPAVLASGVSESVPDVPPEMSRNIPSVITYWPVNEEGTAQEIAIALARAPLADEGQVSRQPADQIRRTVSGLSSPPQTDVDIAAPKTVVPIGEVGQSSDQLIGQALPGLASLQGGNRPSPKLTVRQFTGVGLADQGIARRALPGMVPSAQVPDGVSESEAVTQLPQHSPLLDKKEGPSLGSSPSKHSRIPSTGNRATVMDVAQALNESEGSKSTEKPPAASDSPRIMAPNGLRSFAPPPAHAEKRKSSYEKYSSIILPPLKEEATPNPTPAGTLSRKEGDARQSVLEKGAQENVEQPVETASILGKALSRLPARNDSELSHEVKKFPPGFNIDSLINRAIRPAFLEPGTATISVEVMAITGTTASTLTKDRTIFYDTEILAIIHRSKSQLSGLVSTAVWGWEGKRAKLGDREQRKLQELAKRYGTSVDTVHQYSEPAQLVHVLGGVLAIRQGTRAHWTPENTAMHLVRSSGGVILVDEKDLSVRNLCSAYSYCVSILGSVYVWHGRGSIPLERKAAVEYGRCLMTNLPPTELTEGGSEDDEMFWMILGDEEYANADYWKWRRSSAFTDPRIWRVKVDLGMDCVASVDFISNETCVHDSVYIIDCIWELYVMVGSDARAHKEDIELALDVASGISARVSSSRPYPPTTHAIVLPSQLPRDLQLVFRDLDEFSVNKGEIPDHMNILSLAEAYNHLKHKFWDGSVLQDQTMLPLGVDPSQLS